MSRMIQLRNVPDALHRRLKAQAATLRIPLSDYLLSEIREIAKRPTLAEMHERLHQRERVTGQIDTVRIFHEARGRR